MFMRKWMLATLNGALFSALAGPAFADCSDLPDWKDLKTAVTAVVAAGDNGGLGFNMWGTLVATDGTVCAVAFSGGRYVDQWLGSRVISAQKANTANAFSLGRGSTPATSLFGTAGLALSTANLFTAVQPGGSLYGLQHSNPVDATAAYQGNATLFGTANDPLVGDRVGGINVFGGGLVLMTTGGIRVGGVGVSGDTSCTDHMVAWRVRSSLGLDHFGQKNAAVGGVSGDATHPDNIIFDITPTPEGGLLNPGGTLSKSAGGFGHPQCLNNPDLSTLPPVRNP